ncbi:hypothetical protein QCA50_020708 [Cerrena zonata]|uniref:FAD/NAD(P)-binding domain-containing protein n=1 Tax=Cerrena zonata TaxID=2478898 RepID=A0AAW0FBZ7_9APHY
MTELRSSKICIIGSGAAGLITAHTLIQDGFQHVEILTRDSSSGGVWAAQKVYPGLTINNVHGEFRFPPLPMLPPSNSKATGGRLSGDDMQTYMESFADHFLKGRIRYQVEALRLRRSNSNSNSKSGSRWVITIRDERDGSTSEVEYDKVVLCSGGCSNPHIPDLLSSVTARKAGFEGPIIHSSEFASNITTILNATHSDEDTCGGHWRCVASHLANRGRRVQVVFETADAIIAAPIPLPPFIRKSRFLPIISPHVELRTKLERFLHTTYLGSLITKALWGFLSWSSFFSLGVPHESPLRHTHSLFYGVRTNDEGVGRPNGFHALVNAGKIEVVAPARAIEYERSAVDKQVKIKLNNGLSLDANAVVLATGFRSSWEALFDADTLADLGLNKYPIPYGNHVDEWDAYTTLERSTAQRTIEAACIYRGLVPANNILNRDFAINGAIFTTNNGYTYTVAAHWISSYFLADPFLRLPSTPEKAMRSAERNGAWLCKRYPGILGVGGINESYCADVAFWSWPQACATLLEDMGLQIWRSGGNWLTWVFKPMDLDELKGLKEEREERRRA